MHAGDDSREHAAEAARDSRTLWALGCALHARISEAAAGLVHADRAQVRAEMARLHADFDEMHARDLAGEFDGATHARFRARAQALIDRMEATPGG